MKRSTILLLAALFVLTFTIAAFSGLPGPKPLPTPGHCCTYDYEVTPGVYIIIEGVWDDFGGELVCTCDPFFNPLQCPLTDPCPE